VKKDERPGWVTEIRKYKIITPLYGGGEETQKADSVTTVRATEVRGHLRFWWRATRGGLPEFEGKLEKMREREEQIWGSSAEKDKQGPSQVSVFVSVLDQNKGTPVFKKDVFKKREGRSVPTDIGEPQSPWSYVAFPLRVEKDEHGRVTKPAGSVLENVEFELKISCPAKLKDEVEVALWAWETFGGIGARTRRGFGALQCVEKVDIVKNTSQKISAPKHNEVNADYIKKHLESGGKWPAGVPHLSSNLKFVTKVFSGDTIQASIQAWEYVFGKLKNFRQDRYQGSTSPYGRSKWPEPDAIRRLPGIPSAAKHRMPRSTIDKFPRGQFGLPIIFKFKDNDDPAVTTLQGRKLDHNKYIDRLASPLIIRPIACSDGAMGLAVILEWEPVESDERYTPPGGLWLTSKDYGEFQVESDLDASDAKDIEPLKDVDNGKPQPDVLQAFLDFLK